VLFQSKEFLQSLLRDSLFIGPQPHYGFLSKFPPLPYIALQGQIIKSHKEITNRAGVNSCPTSRLASSRSYFAQPEELRLPLIRGLMKIIPRRASAHPPYNYSRRDGGATTQPAGVAPPCPDPNRRSCPERSRGKHSEIRLRRTPYNNNRSYRARRRGVATSPYISILSSLHFPFIK